MGLDGPLGVFADAVLGKMIDVEAAEVAYHKAVNDALETQLIPSASNPELKSLLQA